MATPVKRPTGRDEILDAVLDAAERLFAANGPADVSLRAIAREAGVNYGLVHRHFGTKHALFDRLQRRYADRWAARLDAEPDYRSALEYLLGDAPETGIYLRLLAWTLLTDRDDALAEAPRHHAALDRLPALPGAAAGAGDAAATTAAALALVFGWRFFHPFIVDALHLVGTDPADVHDAVRARLRAIVGEPAAGALRP